MTDEEILATASDMARGTAVKFDLPATDENFFFRFFAAIMAAERTGVEIDGNFIFKCALLRPEYRQGKLTDRSLELVSSHVEYFPDCIKLLRQLRVNNLETAAC